MHVNQPFHHLWNKTVLWGTVFIIQTTDRMQYFTILQYKLHSFSIQDDRSTHGLFAKPLKKFHPIRPSIELRFYIIKNLLCFFFIQCFYRCIIFKSVWYARHFEYSRKWCSPNDWKQRAQRLKLQERLLTINKINIIRWNIYRDNNFHSGRQVLKCL